MSKVGVILAGGSGSRLWPLSRSLHPKQFVQLLGNNSSFKNTVGRAIDLGMESLVVITNVEHRFLVSQQLEEFNIPIKILLEPIQRNTAAAIALAALCSETKDTLYVFSADHEIESFESFESCIKQASILAKNGKLTLLGVKPTSANTNFGYINCGDKLDNGYEINKFIEKPDKKHAMDLISNDNNLWNSGIFIFNVEVFIEELTKYLPSTISFCAEALEKAESNYEFITVNKDSFSKCPDISIDHALMEKTNISAVVPLNSGWNDLGTWDALLDETTQDPAENFVMGDVLSIDTKGSYLRSEHKLLATLGLEDVVVVSTKDAILVASKNKLGKLKSLVGLLKKNNRTEHKLHREVHRPWGKYDSLETGDNFQVKKLTINPGGKLSTQFHNFRSEHWVVVSGIATVIKDGKKLTLNENDSIYFSKKEVHSLENNGKDSLEIIEVQTGEYLGEDDIVRIEDRYGR